MVSSLLCPISCLTISALPIFLSLFVTYACLMSYSLIESIEGSHSFLARCFLNLMKCSVNVEAWHWNIGSLGLRCLRVV